MLNQSSALRLTQQESRGGEDSQQDDQERLAPAHAVGPQADGKLKQTCKSCQGGKETNRQRRQSAFFEKHRQIRQRETDAGHAEKIRTVQANAVATVHEVAGRSVVCRLRRLQFGKGAVHERPSANASDGLSIRPAGRVSGMKPRNSPAAAAAMPANT